MPSFSISREPGFGFPIVEGMTVSLKCEIDANPLSIPKWNRESKTSLPQLETNHDGTLNFTYIKKHDSGWYRCTTQHEFGYFASFAYFLNVRDPGQFNKLMFIFFYKIVFMHLFSMQRIFPKYKMFCNRILMENQSIRILK